MTAYSFDPYSLSDLSDLTELEELESAFPIKTEPVTKKRRR